MFTRARFLIAALALFSLGVLPAPAAAQNKARSVILFIGDGLGPQQIKAAHLYNGGPLAFEKLPHQAQVTTRSANAPITDSAAGATAWAAGVKVNNGVLSVALPGDGKPLKTLLEIYKEQGKSTGLVTTDELTQATPAAFGSHVPSRKLGADIANWYVTATQPDVLIGGGEAGMSIEATRANGYLVFTDAAGMTSAVEAALKNPKQKIAGLFGDGKFPYRYHDQSAADKLYGKTYPTLPEMTAAALKVLDRNPNGFFVMIESALVDKSGHSQLVNDDVDRAHCNCLEVLTLSDAVETAVKWMGGRDDVLIMVTGDHETGGLSVIRDNGKGKFPDVQWTTKGHTGVNVRLFGVGPGSEKIKGTVDNTDVFTIALEATGLDPAKVAPQLQPAAN